RPPPMSPKTPAVERGRRGAVAPPCRGRPAAAVPPRERLRAPPPPRQRPPGSDPPRLRPSPAGGRSALHGRQAVPIGRETASPARPSLSPGGAAETTAPPSCD